MRCLPNALGLLLIVSLLCFIGGSEGRALERSTNAELEGIQRVMDNAQRTLTDVDFLRVPFDPVYNQLDREI